MYSPWDSRIRVDTCRRTSSMTLGCRLGGHRVLTFPALALTPHDRSQEVTEYSRTWCTRSFPLGDIRSWSRAVVWPSLIALLSSRDEEVSAIACYDIGEFVRHYPNGRAIAKRLGAKELVMPLIEHENPELQRHALQAVSKIMVQNWEYVK